MQEKVPSLTYLSFHFPQQIYYDVSFYKYQNLISPISHSKNSKIPPADLADS